MPQRAISLVFGNVIGLARSLVVPAALMYGVYVGQAAGGGSALHAAPWASGAFGLFGDAQAHVGQVISLLRFALQMVAG